MATSRGSKIDARQAGGRNKMIGSSENDRWEPYCYFTK